MCLLRYQRNESVKDRLHKACKIREARQSYEINGSSSSGGRDDNVLANIQFWLRGFACKRLMLEWSKFDIDNRSVAEQITTKVIVKTAVVFFFKIALVISKERRGTVLGRRVQDGVLVGKSVEFGSATDGISPHVFEVNPVPDTQDARECHIVVEFIKAITSLTPHRILGRLDTGIFFVQNLRLDMLMVEYERRKIAVDAVIDIDLVSLLVGQRILFHPAGDHLTCNREGRRDVVASRLTDDANVG